MNYSLNYIACMIVVAAALLGYKNKLKAWQKILAVLFAPATIVLSAIKAIVPIFGRISKYELHGFLPRRKIMVYPLDNDEFLPKDIIMAGSDMMCITDYNTKYGKSITLNDVYGTGYTESLTPEELFECEVFVPRKYGLEPYMPDYIYKRIAIAFAKAFVMEDVSHLRPFISNKTYLAIYKEDKLSGEQCILGYFANWINSATKDKLNIKVTVKWQYNQCRPAVYIRPTNRKIKPANDKEKILLFRVKNGVLEDIVFAPSLLQKHESTFHDLDQPPYSVDFISRFLEENEVPLSNHLPCPICGSSSKSINWRKINIPMGTCSYAGAVSICQSCKKVVELVPNIKVENKEPLPTPEKPLHKRTSVCSPKLIGLCTFESDDEMMDSDPVDERQKNCRNKLREYQKYGNIEKGNDAAIIYAKSSLNDKAIKLFIELSEKGCHNAMINLFTVYWCNLNDYKKATEWLLYIAEEANPSIKCLWNLAVLYYYGENLPNNVLSKDYTKTKSILSQIKDVPMTGKNDSVMKVIANAKKFYPYVGKLNDFSLSGIDIQEAIVNCFAKNNRMNGIGELFHRAQFLSLKPGYGLRAHVAGDISHGKLFESYFYIYDSNENEYNIFHSNIILHDFDISLINVAPTAMGAWQLYLFVTSPAIIPESYYSHPIFHSTNYAARTFIFSPKDLETIKSIQNLDFTTLDHDGLLLPNVVMSKDGKTADVHCCYWNDWEGLIREHVQITFLPNGSAFFGQPDQFTFYHYFSTNH